MNTVIKVGDKFKTRDGHEVEIDRVYTNGTTHPVFGRVLVWENHNWTVDGKWSRGLEDHYFDLIIPPERKSYWANGYGTRGHAGNFKTRQEADAHALSHRTHVLEIITENGEPVDVKIHKVAERATQGEG